MTLLEVDDVSHRFGGAYALGHVSLTAAAGQVTGIIGPNGAGKTTLFEVIAGGLRPEAGTVRLDGADLGTTSPVGRARLGIGRTFQRLEPFGSLTVGESIALATGGRSAARVDDIVELLGLERFVDVRTDQLPTGHARLAELARTLAIEPRVVLLDEPASGLDEAETDRLATVVRTLAERGMGVVLVEHDVRLVMRVCDVVHVLDHGVLIASGAPASIRADPRVRASYLGSPADASTVPRRPQEPTMTTDTEQRLRRLDDEVDSMVRASDPNARASRWGATAMVLGIAIAVVAYFVGHRTTDPFIQNDAGVIAQIGVCITVAGAAVYLRHGLAGALAADSARRSRGNSSRVSQ